MPATHRRHVVPLGLLVASSLVLVACGSGSSSASSSTVTTRAPGGNYLSTSGTGNKTIPSVDVPAKWSLVWKFACSNPSTRRPFRVTVSSSGQPSDTVTDQTGLAGGGYHPFTTGGSTTITVTTTCTWTLLAGTAGTRTFPSTTTTSVP